MGLGFGYLVGLGLVVGFQYLDYDVILVWGRVVILIVGLGYLSYDMVDPWVGF